MSVPQNIFAYKPTFAQVMAWCRQGPSHYLSISWRWSMLPYGVRLCRYQNPQALLSNWHSWVRLVYLQTFVVCWIFVFNHDFVNFHVYLAVLTNVFNFIFLSCIYECNVSRKKPMHVQHVKSGLNISTFSQHTRTRLNMCSCFTVEHRYLVALLWRPSLTKADGMINYELTE